MAKKIKETMDVSTEEKIKEAARKVFMQKGYGATRTRDIAEAAGINLALLNYYFRSKEKLFEIVMMEKMQKMFGAIFPVIMNEAIGLEEKIDMIVANYIDMLLENQDLPIFVLSEIRNHPEKFANQVQAGAMMGNSSFVKQLHERVPHLNPLQFLMSIIGMTVFPFVGKPIFQTVNNTDPKMFDQLMEQRKKLIPIWVKAMIAAS
ncbi:MAG: TetR/AcrR family transcriptional regulator [Ferruginibacter sp.]